MGCSGLRWVHVGTTTVDLSRGNVGKWRGTWEYVMEWERCMGKMTQITSVWEPRGNKRNSKEGWSRVGGAGRQEKAGGERSRGNGASVKSGS